MQLHREGSPPPGLRLPQAKLSRKSNQVARGRIRQFESYMPRQAVRSALTSPAASLRRTVAMSSRNEASSLATPVNARASLGSGGASRLHFVRLALAAAPRQRRTQRASARLGLASNRRRGVIGGSDRGGDSLDRGARWRRMVRPKALVRRWHQTARSLMSLLPTYQKSADDFFAAIAPFEKAFQDAGFSYLAVKFDADFVLLHGRVFLLTSGPTALPPHFRSPHVRAGHYKLAELGLDVRGLIERLCVGLLNTPDGELRFPGGDYAASFVPFYPDALQNQVRHNVLTIIGERAETIRQPDIDWEIKGASRPYEGLQELANEFALGPVTERSVFVEIFAQNISAIDTKMSKLAGTNADIQVLLAKGLNTGLVTLGYRIYLPGAATNRGTLSGEDMLWNEESEYLRGHATLQVPNAAVLNCSVSYDGVTQIHWWLADPTQAQNPRRAVYESFDPKLETLRNIVGAAQSRGQAARDLEAAVAWLLWMLGFSVAHLGGTARTRDAADLIVTSPNGNFAVVECTTGLLKAENKLALLHQRAQTVRATLAGSNAHLRVLPIMVTSRPKNEITPDLEAAVNLGIYVMTRESLEAAINQTLIQPNADQLYMQTEQAVTAALAKYNATP
jgi:hypothetical protein